MTVEPPNIHTQITWRLTVLYSLLNRMAWKTTSTVLYGLVNLRPLPISTTMACWTCTTPTMTMTASLMLA